MCKAAFRRAMFLWQVVFVLPAVAQTPPAAPSSPAASAAVDCQNVVCRKPSSTINLRQRDGSTLTFPAPPLPYFDGATVGLVPGETITLGYPKTGKGLSAPFLVSVKDATGMAYSSSEPVPDMTLSFSLSQDDGKPDMMMTVVNHTGIALAYGARLFAPVAGAIKSNMTSVCPLQAGTQALGFTGFETWPYPIVLILAGGIQALPSGTPAICK